MIPAALAARVIKKGNAMSTSLFANLANATISESGSYLPPNFRGKLRIDKCQIVHPRQGPPAFVVDFTILESNLPDVKVNETRNWYQKHNDSFDSAVLEFMAGVIGYNMNDPAAKAKMETELKPRAPEYAEAAVGPAQILKGREVRVETRLKDTRGGGDFTRHTWSPAA